ncbi:hypothetical protein CAP35_04670 [Chitinophagaceae bacterium IBVUCB1]|nr:hypothetical protein CAP35_04670 [Chitinophagaceae bacterium IBVUCB1]
MEEQEYIKNFNRGYQLAKDEPELLAQITKSNPDSEVVKAMRDGAKEVQREKFREQLKDVEVANGKDKQMDKDLD